MEPETTFFQPPLQLLASLNNRKRAEASVGNGPPFILSFLPAHSCVLMCGGQVSYEYMRTAPWVTVQEPDRRHCVWISLGVELSASLDLLPSASFQAPLLLYLFVMVA